MSIVCYPQLSTGALTQYPVKKTIRYRTIANQAEDRSRVLFADSRAASVHWDLEYQGLSDSERDNLVAFFESVEGRLQSFLFCDPTRNLLGWSGALESPAWQRNSFLTIYSGVADPAGGSKASRITNTGSGRVTLGQEIMVPGSVICCFSFFARSSFRTTLMISRSSGNQKMESALTIDGEWTRYSIGGPISEGGDASLFQIAFDPGSAVEFYGPQVDAQPSPSRYTQTRAGGGVYSGARFDMDALEVTAHAVNQNSCSLRIVTKLNG